jgi:organic radical activating enzyme
MLKVSRMPSGEPEIFRSIQGEGVTAGTPSVFLRLATCNLACSWCDTRYTWDWARYDFDQEVVSLSADEAEERVLAFDRPHLVITGGEPMLQQRELAPLVASLAYRGYYCEVETNGTIVPTDGIAAPVSQWNVSPKTASSGNRRERREVPTALEAFRGLGNAYFKFVVVERPDIDDVRSLADRYRIPADRVILMPEGVTPEALRRRGEWVAEACTEHGFRFSSRLHILLWGAARGR